VFGGGTGMIGYGWKGGIAPRRRQLDRKSGGYTVWNPGPAQLRTSNELTVAAVPVGKNFVLA